jgi:hypothetical protein
MVGDPVIVAETIESLWQPGMRLLAVTFSPSPKEQKEVYEVIHSFCKDN